MQQRKGRVLERCAQQRAQLVQLVDEADAALGRVQRLREALTRHARWPLLALGVGLLLARPRRLARWGSRLWLGWRSWRALRRRATDLLAALSAR